LKNIARQNGSVWRPAPPGLDRITIGYGYKDFAIGTSIDAMERMMPLEGEPFVYELPDFGPAPVDSGGRPIAVIRPATVRKEWRNEARNPLPEYISWCAQELKRTHFVVSVADLSPGHEWLVNGAETTVHQAFHKGELNVERLLALTAAADIVVGGIGWVTLAAI